MASSTGSTSSILGPNGTSNFMSGLASGLDTEDMVEKLLSGTQAKIDKQNAKKQQVEWKQEIYRDLITKINGFTDKYFSFFGAGSTNLLSSSFYNVMTANSTNSAVKVTSATSKAPSNMVIDSITHLATAAKATSANAVTGPLTVAVKSGADGSLTDFSDGTDGKVYSFDLSLDGVRKTIKFEGAANEEGLIQNINNSISRVFGTTVQIDKTSKELKFTDDSHRVVFYKSADKADGVVTENVLENLGFKNGASNKLDYSTCLSDVPFASKLQGKNFTFEINGVEINASAEDTLGDVINRINNSEAEVKVTYSSVTDKFIIESANTGADIKIEMKQSAGNLLTAMFGIEGAGGIGGSVKGLRNSEKIEGEVITDPKAFQAVLDTLKERPSAFALEVNGKEYTIEIPKKESGYSDADEFTEALNHELKKKFGTNTLGQNNVQINHVGNKFEAVSNVGYKVGFSEKNVEKSITGQMGFTANSVQGDTKAENTTLGMLFEGMDFTGATIGGAEITAATTINELMGMIKDTLEANTAGGTVDNTAGCTLGFDEKTGEISITGLAKETLSTGETVPKSVSAEGVGKTVLNTLFGGEQLEVWQGGTELAVTAGQNAVFSVNGATIERNSNSFELDGITMELTAVTTAGDPPINLTTSKDTDKIVEGLKSFVDDYNALIEELNDQINAEASYMKYQPLTDAQKKEMSEREIEKWEEKAKEGLLRNDSNISKFLQEMRSAMYQTVGSAGLALYDIGIEASGNYKDNGKLVLDESKLKSALTTKLDDIQKMFTDKDNGLAVQLQNALKAAANPSSGSPGSLVRYAGTKDVMITSNTLYYEMKSITETLSRLNTKYETERTRYWKQFTAMEQAISKMNSQSSWMTQQFS